MAVIRLKIIEGQIPDNSETEGDTKPVHSKIGDETPKGLISGLSEETPKGLISFF